MGPKVTFAFNRTWGGMRRSDKLEERNRWRLRSAHWLLLGGMLLLGACAQSPAPNEAAPAPAPTPAAAVPETSAPMLVEDAALCGRSLGIAVRCNMLTDQNDFAILRHLALNGLRAQSRSAGDFSQAEMAFDLATLEMMNAVGACQGPAAGLATLEQKIEGTIAHCAKPQP